MYSPPESPSSTGPWQVVAIRPQSNMWRHGPPMGHLGPELWSKCFRDDHKTSPSSSIAHPVSSLCFRENLAGFFCACKYLNIPSPLAYQRFAAIRPPRLKHAQLRSGLCGVASRFQDHVRTLLEPTRNGEAKEEPDFRKASCRCYPYARPMTYLCWSNSSVFANPGGRGCVYPVWRRQWLT